MKNKMQHILIWHYVAPPQAKVGPALEFPVSAFDITTTHSLKQATSSHPCVWCPLSCPSPPASTHTCMCVFAHTQTHMPNRSHPFPPFKFSQIKYFPFLILLSPLQISGHHYPSLELIFSLLVSLTLFIQKFNTLFICKPTLLDPALACLCPHL